MVTVYDYTKFQPAGEVQRVVTFACERLGITDVTVVASLNEKLLKRMSSANTEYQAMLVKTQIPHIYNLVFRPNVSRAMCTEIICHEAIHLLQQERGDLRMNLTTGKCYWKGEEYSRDFPYMERPWEREAFKEQSEMVREYKKSLRKGG